MASDVYRDLGSADNAKPPVPRAPLKYPPEFHAVAHLYKFIGRVGHGTYSSVYVARPLARAAPKYCAVKVLSSQTGLPSQVALRELRGALAGRHANLLPVLEVLLFASGTVALVSPMYNASLYHVLREVHAAGARLSRPYVRHCFASVVRGLAAVPHFMHRDVKSMNVLVSADFRHVCVADWGLSKHDLCSGAAHSPLVITTYYAPPEVLDLRPYDRSADVWSLGVLLFELATLKYVFGVRAADTRDTYLRGVTASCIEERIRGCEPDVQRLLRRMLCVNPADRMTLEELANDDYVRLAPPPSPDQCPSVDLKPKFDACVESRRASHSASLLAVVEPACLSAPHVACAWPACEDVSAADYVAVWAAVRQWPAAHCAWLVAAATARHLQPDVRTADVRPGRLAVALLFLLAEAVEMDVGDGVMELSDVLRTEGVQALLRGAVGGGKGGGPDTRLVPLANAYFATVLKRLGGALPLPPTVCSELSSCPNALDMACFAACFPERLVAVSRDDILAACLDWAAHGEAAVHPTTRRILQWADEVGFTMTRTVPGTTAKESTSASSFCVFSDAGAHAHAPYCPTEAGPAGCEASDAGLVAP